MCSSSHRLSFSGEAHLKLISLTLTHPLSPGLSCTHTHSWIFIFITFLFFCGSAVSSQVSSQRTGDVRQVFLSGISASPRKRNSLGINGSGSGALHRLLTGCSFQPASAAAHACPCVSQPGSIVSGAELVHLCTRVCGWLTPSEPSHLCDPPNYRWVLVTWIQPEPFKNDPRSVEVMKLRKSICATLC